MMIQISKLKDVANSILAHVCGDLKVDSYKLPRNSYWDVIDLSARYECQGEPPEPSVRAAFDDWTHIEDEVLVDPAGKVPVLVDLSNLLRMVGDHIPDFLKCGTVNDIEVKKTNEFLKKLASESGGNQPHRQHQIDYYETQFGKNSTEIQVSKLQQMADRILEHVVSDIEISSYTIQEDCVYWDVVGTLRYKTGKAPTPDLGKLIEDWGVVMGIDPADPVGKSPALVQLSSLLRAIGDHPFDLIRKDK